MKTSQKQNKIGNKTQNFAELWQKLEGFAKFNTIIIGR